ncbi:MAG: fibrobacter succinogenes major paralogous domain-containing protein [Dysgonamonadaceae bacterium]|nr:fibrobacter succinogenes major paralogous domain-containing protein [Dysgonamonadaceae bacterium]
MKFLVLALLMLSAVSANAQVTIGSNQGPPAYSLLELDAGSYKGGLHLPRLTTEERDALSLDTGAAGLLIFNISTSCLDIWTGSTWKSQCESTLPEGVNPSSFSFEENGRYALYGKILFDVNGGNVSDYPEPYKNYPSDYPHTCDLSSKLSYDYTLKSSPENSYTFSSAQFVVDDPTGLLDSYSTTTDATVTLTFKSLAEVKTLVGNAGRANAKKITIKALFLDNKGEQKKAELVVRVQNAPVGCSVRKVGDPTSPATTVNGWLTFMCYNLGANPDYGDPAIQKSYVPSPNTGSSTDRTVYGDLYQWGRVDDGHQRRDLTPENIWPADNLGSTTGFTEDPVPNDAVYINTTTGQVLETDARFGKFIRRNTTNYDWIAGDTYVYNNRWDTTGTKLSKAPADPCPTGWRVPTNTEWASIYGTTVNCGSADCYTNAKVNKWLHNFEIPPAGDTGTHGVSLTPSTAQGNTTYGTYPTLFLSAGDDRNRDHATIDNSGTRSIYWSSTVVGSSINAYGLGCSSTHVNPSSTGNRSGGRSVRCVAE